MRTSDDALTRSLDDLSAMTAGEDVLIAHIIGLLDQPFSESSQRAAADFLVSKELKQINAAARRVMNGADETESEGEEVSEC